MRVLDGTLTGPRLLPPWRRVGIARVLALGLLGWSGARAEPVERRDASGPAPDGIGRVRALAGTFEGRAYDAIFGWSDQRLYCSELVWKLYERGLDVRLDEPVISPAAIFASPLLEPVGSPGAGE